MSYLLFLKAVFITALPKLVQLPGIVRFTDSMFDYFYNKGQKFI